MSPPPLEYKELLRALPESPLVVFVHGRAGTKEVMWTFSRTVAPSMNIVAPQAPRPDPIGGWSWWDVQGEITDEMINEGVGQLSLFLDQYIVERQLRPSSVVALGFSQGGGAVSVLAQQQPGRFRGVGLLASFVIRQPEPPAVWPHFFVAHGEQDTVVPITRTLSDVAWLRDRGAHVEVVTDPVAHKVGVNGTKALQGWLLRVAE